MQTGDYTANRQFVKTKTAHAARAVIFAKWAFGGVKAHFAKLQLEIGLLQTGDYTANLQFVETKTACAARAVIFTKWAFGGVKAHFAKLQL